MSMLISPPAHFGKPHANQVLEWLPGDTHERLREQMRDPVKLAYVKEQGWDLPGAITYRFNSHGFRGAEFDQGPCVITLGCSFTVGIGLPESAIWPQLVADEFGVQCANLAWGGYSTDTCYRLAEYWVPRLRPMQVFMLSPPRSRLELLLHEDSETEFEVFLPNSESRLFQSSDTVLKHWFLNDENALLNQRRNIRAIEHLCDKLRIPVKILKVEQNFSGNRCAMDVARDFAHFGPTWHKIVAKEFLDASH